MKQPIIPGLNLSLQIILYIGSTNENLYPPKLRQTLLIHPTGTLL